MYELQSTFLLVLKSQTFYEALRSGSKVKFLEKPKLKVLIK